MNTYVDPPPEITQRLSDLLDDRHSWGNYTVFGESIPHLLHWDWAYLWVLERQSAKPLGWEERIEAWRRLLCMLLLGELQLDARPIGQPLLSYTAKLNLTQVVFLKAPQQYGQSPIGVLSPTVIVRPLPEPNRFEINAARLARELPRHYDPPASIRDRRGELAQMLGLARTAIGQSNSQLSPALVAILERNLQITPSFAPQGQTYPVVPLANGLPLVAKADGSAWEELRLVNIPLMIRQGQTAHHQQFVPRCSCGALLTYADSEAAVDVVNNVSLTCRSCGLTKIFGLSDFGIWKHGNTFYVWRELEQLEGLSQQAIPPQPEVLDDEVHFRWNPALLAGEAARVHVRLKFPQHHVRAVGVSEIKYHELLVPGELDEAFDGLPIRPEWLFAVDNIPTIHVSGDVISFRNARLKGLSHPVTLGRYPKSACRIAPDMQLGIFPAPMYEGWGRYRFFWSGRHQSEYRICIVPERSEPAIQKPQTLGTADWPGIIPDAVAIQSNSETDVPAPFGATWLLPRSSNTEVASQAIYVGIDFGTTNTVVYVQSQDSHPAALELRDFAAAAHVIAGDRAPRTSFLPPPLGNGTTDTDQTLIPSALWFSLRDHFHPIRWADPPPTTFHSAVHGFKWGAHQEALRKQYLEELLFLTLPTTLKKLFPGNPVKGNWNIGFAFPLAFPDYQRAEYARLLRGLRQQIDAYTLAPVDIRSINESYACVRAFGEHLHGSVFLIADLGGGSLDVALFELVTADGRAMPKHFQVGSAKIGGETFVTALAHRMGTDDESRERHYWKVRQAIMEGRVAHEFPGANFANVASRFLPIAQELLRMMVEAFQVSIPNKKVELVLVGNGWRIGEFNAATPVAESIARSEMAQSFQRFEIPTLCIYAQQLEGPAKHLVALGALKNAKPGGQNELDEATSGTKMPAGRNLKLTNSGETIQWFDLVGPAVSNLAPGTGPGHIEIQRASGPEPPAAWLQRLQHSMPSMESNPTDAYVRDNLSISGERLAKGPLQVILEKRAEDLE